MSLITELVQLFKQLDTEITDRKIRDHFVPIKEKFLELREQQFELEQQHVKQIADQKAAHEVEVRELKNQLSQMEAAATGQHEECPFCRRRTFEVVEIKDHPVMSAVGVKLYCHKCSYCNKTEERTVTPGASDSGHGGGRVRRR